MKMTYLDTRPMYRAAVLVFDGSDILDFAGPIEILSHALHNIDREAPEPIFSVETVCRTKNAPIPTGKSTMFVQPTMSIAEALRAMDTFHVLVVPGGPPNVMRSVLDMEDGLELELIKQFAKLKPAADGQSRIILSICTGALLLGAAGVLKGLKVTTHHQALDLLKGICDGVSDAGNENEKTEVIGGQRFVDAGIIKDGLRIVTAGGVSSGLDATLHLVELVKDRDTAEFISGVIEYQRRQV
jgi:putative intracellular protease/amidase